MIRGSVAIRPSINPEAITGKRPTKETAMKMVSGSALLNPSAFTGYAANKIVEFNRAKIQPKPNNLQSLIQNLSSSVYNNLTNIQNVFGGNKTNIKEIKQLVQTKGSKENKGIFGFFGNVKETLSLIQFLGSKKNLSKLKENLENLKTNFSESFEVAKALRKVIKKIYDQLSGMDGFPSGGGGGGILGALSGLLGLRSGAKLLGKKVPAPGAVIGEKGAGMLPKIPKFLGSPGKLVLGTGALAAGAAVSGITEPGGENMQVLEQTDIKPSGTILDKFNSVLDRFDKAIDSLIKDKPGTKSSGKEKPSSSGGRSTGPGNSGSSSSSYGGTGDLSTNISSNEEDLLMRLMIAEAGGEGEMGMAAVARSVLNRAGLIQSGRVTPGTFNSAGGSISQVISASKQYTPYAQGKLNRALKPDEIKRAKAALEIAQNQADMRGRLEAVGVPASTINLIMASTGFRNYDAAGVDLSQKVNEVKFGRHTFNTAGNVGKIIPSSVQISPSVPVLPSPQQLRRAEAPQVRVVNVGGQAQVQSKPSGSGIIAPPAPPQNGPTAPSGSSFNPDNFLVLYSRMVYNIVDG
jgi:hypothetical protein